MWGGNGFVSLALQKEGYKTVLVEPGISGTQNAKSRGLKRIIYSAFNRNNTPILASSQFIK